MISESPQFGAFIEPVAFGPGKAFQAARPFYTLGLVPPFSWAMTRDLACKQILRTFLLEADRLTSCHRTHVSCCALNSSRLPTRSASSYSWTMCGIIRACRISPAKLDLPSDRDIPGTAGRGYPVAAGGSAARGRSGGVVQLDRAVTRCGTSEAIQKRQLAAGASATAATCDDDMINAYDFDKLFYQRVNLHGCSVFWDWKPPAPSG